MLAAPKHTLLFVSSQSDLHYIQIDDQITDYRDYGLTALSKRRLAVLSSDI